MGTVQSKGDTTLALHNKQGGWYFAYLSNLKPPVGTALHVLLLASYKRIVGAKHVNNGYLKKFVGRRLKSRHMMTRPVKACASYGKKCHR